MYNSGRIGQNFQNKVSGKKIYPPSIRYLPVWSTKLKTKSVQKCITCIVPYWFEMTQSQTKGLIQLSRQFNHCYLATGHWFFSLLFSRSCPFLPSLLTTKYEPFNNVWLASLHPFFCLTLLWSIFLFHLDVWPWVSEISPTSFLG